MRILHCIESLRSGGKERQLIELLKGMSAEPEFESRVVIMSDHVFFREIHEIPGVRVETIRRRIRKDPTAWIRLRRLCREYRPDVVTAWDSMTAVYALPAARAVGAKFVNLMIQDAPSPLPFQRRLRARLTFPLSDVILANSAAGLKAYGVSGPRARVIHNGFDGSRLRALAAPDEVRRRLGIQQSRVVGMVAEFRADKDQPALVRAARLVRRQRADVAFLFVGGGAGLAGCRALAGEMENETVFFPGRIETREVESIVNVFDVGVLATFTEGISNSIMEYMMLGKPVIATDCDGTRELVIHPDTGFLVPRSDAEALAARIGQLLDDPALGAEMGARGRARVEQEFSLQRMTDEFCGLFRSLGPGPRRKRSRPASTMVSPC